MAYYRKAFRSWQVTLFITWFVTTLAARTAKRLFWAATYPAKTQGFKCHGRRGGKTPRDNQRSLAPSVWLELAAGGGTSGSGKPVEWSPAPWARRWLQVLSKRVSCSVLF